jgi:hypothetical protein
MNSIAIGTSVRKKKKKYTAKLSVNILLCSDELQKSEIN